MAGLHSLLLAIVFFTIAQFESTFQNDLAVCDFSAKASDQEFCGSCDFEEDSCGWIDVSNDVFRWRLERANISSFPGVDHTTGSPWGQVMHVNGTTFNLFSMAVLEYTFPIHTTFGCQISFWYHLHDPIGISSHFALSLITNTTNSVVLWEIQKGQTDGWVNASVRVGNRPKDFKLVFSLDPSMIGNQDVMLDDIKLMGCTEDDIPPYPEPLSCDFEKDTCAWYIDHSASLTWKRTNGQNPSNDNQGPGYDHTIVSGYYMFTATKKDTNPSQTARLISYPQQSKCVSFWYHIYGSNIGSLRFIAKCTDGTETLMWIRSGTQGNKWHFADFSFANNSSPVQFIFEAHLGGTDGSIALDDVQVQSSVNGSCPSERECTFQSSLCGLQPDPAADFSWIRITGKLASGSPSPSMDHTLGTDQGYYLSAQLWNNSLGTRSAMMMRQNEPTQESGECWIFWYYMSGRNVGTLNVYLQYSDNSHITLWSLSGDQGSRWRPGRATVLSPQTPYQVRFEAVVGDGPVNDIAIDDLTILNGPCPPHGLCDFEMDQCGWLSSSFHNVSWGWTSGASATFIEPKVDHTTNSGLGHYIAFVTKLSSVEQIAYLQSELMQPVTSACLEVWYYMDMSGILDKLTLTVYVNESGTLQVLWNQTSAQRMVWHNVTLDYQASEQYQIVFEAKWLGSHKGVAALDDIYIREGVSCSDMISTTLAPTTQPTSPPASSMDCSFEDGLCDWVQETDDGYDWTRQKGQDINTNWKGPLYDHTIENMHGFYLVLNMAGDKDGERAVISTSTTAQSSTICVAFWYFMLGPSVASLDLVVEMETKEIVMWTRERSAAAEWLKAQVTINMADIQKVKIAGGRNAKGNGFIALDDIRVTAGACKDHNPCGFEHASMCGFEHNVGDITHWLLVNGTIGHVDHTYRTAMGHFMAVLGTRLLGTERTHLLSPVYSKTAELCVQFWYWQSVSFSDSLSVHVYMNGELGPALWSVSGVYSVGWDIAEVTVSSPSEFRVAFKAELSSGQESFILLDDVSVRNGACPSTGSCDFELGLCTWVNGGSNSDNWVHSDGHFYSPLTDHTTRTADGRFMLSPPQTSGPDNSSRALLISERILHSPVSSDSCLSFWYYINDSNSVTLRVFLDVDNEQQKLIFEASKDEHNWRNFSTTVSEIKSYQILLEAESGNRGLIAVDDIIITKGTCEEMTLVSGVFVGCQFEEHSCEWEDLSVGQFSWQRGRNGTATTNTGPSVDHTTGTQLGWYMVVEASYGTQNSYAALQSPAMKQASAVCVLEFYYHMYGEGIGELKVFIQQGLRRTLLWWNSGDYGDKWHRAEVVVGRTYQVFTILFEATRTFSELGDIAIDDIAFLNCSLPEPQESCSPKAFKCSNLVCVEASRVCDFSNDCGDGSDEVDCDQLGYKQRCSFEQGMCLWEANEDWAGWTLDGGKWAEPYNGPPRDHTRNIAAGHFIIPSQQSQRAEIISSTLLPSSNCTVSFYHFPHGTSSTAKLTIRLRTLQSVDYDVILWEDKVTHGFHWQRTEVTFSSSVKAKIVFQFVRSAKSMKEYLAVDDVSFSPNCFHDPDNSQLPIVPATFPPTIMPTTPTTTEHPCKEDEFYCWRSDGMPCIPAGAYCDYLIDCPLGEEEETCGPCTFEYGLCNWSDISQDKNTWQSVNASENTEPPADHTTGTGQYMYLNFSMPSKHDAQLQSPPLPPTSPYCQILFYFYMSGEDEVGGLSLFLQNEDNKKTQLWTRTNSTETGWTLERLAIGKQEQLYKIIFSSPALSFQSGKEPVHYTIALDDISFLNCETSYQPSALSSADCSFEEDLCGWVHGSIEDFHWLRNQGPSETVNTGPAGDHTSSTGYYLYIKSSSSTRRGNIAQLKSPVLPPAGQNGYCLTVWYHMFGATVGSLKIILQDIDSRNSSLVWQRTGSQGNEWQLAQKHVTLQEVHQILIEVSVGGKAGDVAIDDLSLAEGSCSPKGGLCDFEAGNCDWMQLGNNDVDWIRGSGALNSQPSIDHTTNTNSGYYLYMGSSSVHVPGHTSRISSPLFTAENNQCLHLWFYMSGQDPGKLNVYQEFINGSQSLLLSQSGEHGKLWRFAQAPLSHTGLQHKLVVEGIKGETEQSIMAVDDVLVSNYPCSSPGYCDFEVNMCSWSNVIIGDDMDWLRNQQNTQAPNTGPSVDHTTNSSTGYYLYVDTSVGQWSDKALLLSEIFLPESKGPCFTFWYHMYGNNVGTLNLYINNRTLHDRGERLGHITWTESGDQGDVWRMAKVYIHQREPFWLVFEYLKGKGYSGDVAIDDVQIIQGACDAELPTTAVSPNVVGIGMGVSIILLVIAIICTALYVLHKRHSGRGSNMETDMITRNAVFDVCHEIQDSET